MIIVIAIFGSFKLSDISIIFSTIMIIMTVMMRMKAAMMMKIYPPMRKKNTSKRRYMYDYLKYEGAGEVPNVASNDYTQFEPSLV